MSGVGKESRRLTDARRLFTAGAAASAVAPEPHGAAGSVSKKLGSVGQIELLQMQSYPKFHNEIGVPIVRVGCREFECIGAMPPQDHHIYLNMGDASDIVCPYCSTLFHFDPSLGANDADPADCAYSDMD